MQPSRFRTFPLEIVSQLQAGCLLLMIAAPAWNSLGNGKATPDVFVSAGLAVVLAAAFLTMRLVRGFGEAQVRWVAIAVGLALIGSTFLVPTPHPGIGQAVGAVLAIASLFAERESDQKARLRRTKGTKAERERDRGRAA
jgi:hypothetical protein